MSSRHTAAPPSDAVRALLAALLLASGLTVVGLAPPAAAAARADLTVSAVRSPGSAAPGEQVALTAVVKNVGRRDAATTATRFVLSRDQVSGSSDTALGTVRTRALDRRSQRTARLSATLPATQATGRWYVVACADANRRVRESREGNNCRASAALTLATPAGPTFAQEPDPLAVGASTLEVQNRKSATAAIETATTITATATDGTTYALRIPPTALLTPEEITLTPVTSVAGLPLTDGLRAGVQIEPHGLMLQAPATLVIDSPELGPLPQQTPFVFHEAGEDVHAYPVMAPRAADDEDVVRLELSHFSTAGVGSGTTADRSNLAAHRPARSSSQLAAAMAELTRAERASQEAGKRPDPSVPQQQLTALESYANEVAAPRLAAAAGNPDLAPGAVAEAISVARQIALLDEDNPVAAEILDKVVTLLESLIAPYDRRCQQHDLRAIPLLIGLARQLALLAGDESASATRAFDAAMRCARYEVTLDSTMDYARNYTQDDQTVTNNAHLRLQSTTEVPTLTPGFSELGYTEASLGQRIEGEGAWIEDTLVSTRAGSITADVLERANPVDPGPDGPPPAPPIPYVRLLPGVGADGAVHEPTERLRRTTSLPGYEPTEEDTTFWMQNMTAFSDFYPLRIEEDLEPRAGDAVLLEKTRDGSFGSVSSIVGQVTEHRVVKVTHTPQAG